jgi:hypothetical protein
MYSEEPEVTKNCANILEPLSVGKLLSKKNGESVYKFLALLSKEDIVG